MAVKGHAHSFGREIGEGIGDDIAWLEKVTAGSEFLDVEAEVIEEAHDPVLEVSIMVPFVHELESVIDFVASIRSHRKQAVVPALPLIFGLLLEGFGGLDELVKRVRLEGLQAFHEDLGPVEVLFKGVESFGIPTGIALSAISFDKGNMDVDGLALPDAVESPDPLF
jgi:hypothetical protein